MQYRLRSLFLVLLQPKPPAGSAPIYQRAFNPLPLVAAMMTGVVPLRFRTGAFTFASAATSAATQSVWPLDAARNTGVTPSPAEQFTSACAATRMTMQWLWPKCAAIESDVLPALFRWSTSALAFTNAATHSAWPFHAAMKTKYPCRECRHGLRFRVRRPVSNRGTFLGELQLHEMLHVIANTLSDFGRPAAAVPAPPAVAEAVVKFYYFPRK